MATDLPPCSYGYDSLHTAKSVSAGSNSTVSALCANTAGTEANGSITISDSSSHNQWHKRTTSWWSLDRQIRFCSRGSNPDRSSTWWQRLDATKREIFIYTTIIDTIYLRWYNCVSEKFILDCSSKWKPSLESPVRRAQSCGGGVSSDVHRAQPSTPKWSPLWNSFHRWPRPGGLGDCWRGGSWGLGLTSPTTQRRTFTSPPFLPLNFLTLLKLLFHTR